MKARNVAALWHTFRAAGAQCLVMVGPAPDKTTVSTYRNALPRATVTLCRLHAGSHELTRRILRRGEGHNWPAPGDPLRGLPAARLLRVAACASSQAAAMERAGIGDVRVDTGGRPPEDIAAEIAASWRGVP